MHTTQHSHIYQWTTEGLYISLLNIKLFLEHHQILY